MGKKRMTMLKKFPHNERVALVLLLGVYFILAGTGVFFAYGFAGAVGDESVLTTTTLKMFAERSLIPADQYNYHMPLPAYLYAPAFAASFAALRVSGVFSSTHDLIEFGILDWGELLVIARLISIALGAASLWLLYAAARRIAGVPAALLATFFTGTHLLFVVSAHFGQVWMPQIFALLLALYAIVRLYEEERPTRVHYALAGLAIVISFGMHFIGILAYAPFLAAHWLKQRAHGVRSILVHQGFHLVNAMLLASIPILYLMNPYGTGNYFMRSFTSFMAPFSGVSAPDVGSVSMGEKFFEYGRILFEYQPLLVLLFIPAIVLFAMRKREWAYILGSFIAAYYIVIGPLVGGAGLRIEPRFILPLVPFMSIIAAYVVVSAYGYAAARSRLAAVAALGCVLAVSLGPAVLWDYRLAGTYTSVEALRWVEGNVLPGSRIAYFDFGSPTLPLHEDEQTLRDIGAHNPAFMTTARAYLLEHPSVRAARQPSYYILNMGSYWKKPTPEALLADPFDYAIVAWWDRDRRVLVEKQLAVARIDLTDARRIAVFPEHATSETDGFNLLDRTQSVISGLLTPPMPGPVIEIYEL